MLPKDNIEMQKQGSARAKARWLKPAVFVSSMLPFAYLIWLVVSGNAGANPIEFIEKNTGEWSLRFLILSLAMTPIAELMKSPHPVRLRRMIGLFTFFYVCLHVLAYVLLDQSLNVGDIIADVLERPFISAGFVAFMILIPLALTSNRYMVTKLKTKWKILHRWVYVASVAAILHYVWLAKGERIEPIAYLVVVMLLLSYGEKKWL